MTSIKQLYTISTCTVHVNVCVHVDQYSSQLTEDVHPKRADQVLSNLFVDKTCWKNIPRLFHWKSLGGKPTNPCAPFLQILDLPLQWRIYGGGGVAVATQNTPVSICKFKIVGRRTPSQTPALPAFLQIWIRACPVQCLFNVGPASVVDDEPTLNQHWFYVQCLLECQFKWLTR